MLMILEWVLLFLFSSFFVWFLVCVFLYRLLKTHNALTFIDVPRYRFIQLTQGSRWYFEKLIGNKLIETGNDRVLFVSKKDYLRLWPEPFHRMSQKNMSFEGTFEVYKLFFGGYSIAKLVSIKQVNSPPLAIK